MEGIMKLINLVAAALLSIATSSQAYVIPIKALMKCETKDGVVFKPLLNSEVNLATNAQFLPTDSQGYFYLDDAYKTGEIKIYLAHEETILISCYSRFFPLSSGVAVLGERGGSCPCKS